MKITAIKNVEVCDVNGYFFQVDVIFITQDNGDHEMLVFGHGKTTNMAPHLNEVEIQELMETCKRYGVTVALPKE